VLRDGFVKMLQMPDTVEDVEQLVVTMSELSVITSPTE
jgi:hypothetical protein